MGWTGIYNWIEKKNGQVDRKATVDRELTYGMNRRIYMENGKEPYGCN